MSQDPVLWGALTSRKHRVELPREKVPPELAHLPGPVYVMSRGTSSRAKKRFVCFCLGAPVLGIAVSYLGGPVWEGVGGLVLLSPLPLLLVLGIALLFTGGGEFGWTLASPSWIARSAKDGVHVVRYEDVRTMGQIGSSAKNSTMYVLTGPDGFTYRAMAHNVPRPVQASLEQLAVRFGGRL